MVDKNTERNEVACMYASRKWVHKVNQMSDEQVHAIYMKEQERKAREAEEEKKKEREEDWW